MILTKSINKLMKLNFKTAPDVWTCLRKNTSQLISDVTEV